MKPSLLMITGWAYGPDAMQPLAAALPDFSVQLLSGAEVLAGRAIPDADAIVGWSLGGMLAMELLPARCRTLVLISSTARFCATDGYPCGVPERVLRRMILQFRQSPETVWTEFHANACAPRPPHPPGPLPHENAAAGLEYLLATDLRARLPALTIPVLLLHGEEDRIIPPGASDWLAQALPAATCVRLSGEGHRPDPLVLAPLIQPFLVEARA